jgi:2-hydroxyacyl-CoA lyase 1
MTGKPGVCLVVSGPGLIHALAGLSNAQMNCWPMIVIGGASEGLQDGRGAFQEFPQVDAARLYCKYSARPPTVQHLPLMIEKAFRSATFGRPGACYIDVPAEFVLKKVPATEVLWAHRVPPAPRPFADPKLVEQAIQEIKAAKRPLVIVGKGAAYSRAESEVRAFVEATNLPWLATPMGKGVVDDEQGQNVIAARSQALKGADLIVLLGARLNWILHFGLPPRYATDVKLIQVDIFPEELGTNVQATVPLCGDVKSIVGQMLQTFDKEPYRFSNNSDWWKALNAKIEGNKKTSEALMADNDIPMSYYRVFAELKKDIPRDFVLVNEGANTMDIARTIFDQPIPRSRLDAGTFGTMGLGTGFALAAQMVHPNRPVVCIQGDSAFGFSGMEVETAIRHKLPIIFIVINNGGIYMGLDEESYKSADVLPTTSLTAGPMARYEKFAEAFGHPGYYCTKPEEVRASFQKALKDKKTCVINVVIQPAGQRKAQEFEWLTRTDVSKL